MSNPLAKELLDDLLPHPLIMEQEADRQRRRRKLREQEEAMIQRMQMIERPRRGGSRPGKRPNISRDFARAQLQIELDYFVEDPVFPPEFFQKRFRIPLPVYLQLKAAILDWEAHNLTSSERFFELRSNCAGAVGASPDQKLLSALNQLAYGTTPDESDHYFRISKTVALNSLVTFCRRIHDILGDDYLREPTAAEVQCNSDANSSRGFPGMFGSIDCYHWTWHGCPRAHHGAYQDRHQSRSMILQLIADQDLRIWYPFFGSPGSHNDVNVLHHSDLIGSYRKNSALRDFEFPILQQRFKGAYFLADGIYPDWPLLMGTINVPRSDAAARFKEAQESARKDVERALGVLIIRFKILSRPSLKTSVSTHQLIMKACIILHNYLVERRVEGYASLDESEELTLRELYDNGVAPLQHVDPASGRDFYIDSVDRSLNKKLQAALISFNGMLNAV